MWYLNALLYGVLFLGWGVIVYALAVGVRGLLSQPRGKADRKELAEFQAWNVTYKEWYNSFNDEREYYADAFENIIQNIDEFNNMEKEQDIYFGMNAEGVKVIRGVLSSYVDGVRSSKEGQ